MFLYKERESNKYRKRIIIVTIVLIVFSIITLVTGRAPSSIETILKDTIANVEYYVIKTPIQYIGNLFSEYNDLKDVYEENALLKEQLDKYAREAALNETLSLELEDLKELTKIDFLPTDYNVRYTKVIARDVESWSNEVTIDLGETSGIKEGMAVISAKGMIGTVTNVEKISATVSLLSAENAKSQIPVMIISEGNEYYGLLNKYDLESKSYSVTLLSDVEKIEKDAKVVTSGLGGVGKSPKGILIGTVDSYTPKKNATESVCQVKPSVDFDDLNYVAVVQRVNTE